MKLPIKFRGRFWNKDGDLIALGDPKDGDFIYGGYARMTLCLDDGEGDYIINKEGEALLIYPDSVKQLVGYDINGREVYMEFTEMAKKFGWTVKEAEKNGNDI